LTKEFIIARVAIWLSILPLTNLILELVGPVFGRLCREQSGQKLIKSFLWCEQSATAVDADPI